VAPRGIDRFLRALASVESGGRYTARNPVSGAYGKYQILPSMWRAWARLYLGNANAAPTPRNQEHVARAKVSALHRWLRSWRQVAYWWLTGRDGRHTTWSTTARFFVTKVMARYARLRPPTGGSSASSPTWRTVADGSRAIAYAGRWRTARHGAYQGGKAHYATAAGATATFAFTGRAIRWQGPVGPTRGKARISLDGNVVATIDLRARSFRARKSVWSMSWPGAGAHTVVVEVLGTRGRPYVAIDAFHVRP
jgi:hypothetical protein